MQCDPTDRLLAEKSKYDTAIDLYNNHHLLQMEKIGDTCYGCAVCVCFSRHVIAETVNKANIDTDFSLLTRCFDKSYALYCRKVDEMLIKWRWFINDDDKPWSKDNGGNHYVCAAAKLVFVEHGLSATFGDFINMYPISRCYNPEKHANLLQNNVDMMLLHYKIWRKLTLNFSCIDAFHYPIKVVETFRKCFNEKYSISSSGPDSFKKNVDVTSDVVDSLCVFYETLCIMDELLLERNNAKHLITTRLVSLFNGNRSGRSGIVILIESQFFKKLCATEMIMQNTMHYHKLPEEVYNKLKESVDISRKMCNSICH